MPRIVSVSMTDTKKSWSMGEGISPLFLRVSEVITPFSPGSRTSSSSGKVITKSVIFTSYFS